MLTVSRWRWFLSSKCTSPIYTKWKLGGPLNVVTYNLKIGVVPLSDEQLQWICVGRMSSTHILSLKFVSKTMRVV